MAEPARKAPDHGGEPESWEELEADFVHRWVESPSGRMEFQEFPLTPEYFLDPQIGDQVVQTPWHFQATFRLYDIVTRHLSSSGEKVLVLSDVKLLWGHREWRRPSPDLTVIPGLGTWREPSFNVAQAGVRPSLIVEVVSFSNVKIRKTDLVDKVELYEREKIREYLALDPPQRANGNRCQWIGYRLDDEGRYGRIAPDADGRIFAETVGLRFGVSPDGQEILVFDARTGERVLTAAEIDEKAARDQERAEREAERAEREAKKAVQEAKRADREAEKAAREMKARKTAEAEVSRLREEIARLKGSGD